MMSNEKIERRESYLRVDRERRGRSWEEATRVAREKAEQKWGAP